MNRQDRKSHWDNIYQTKKLEEVGWYQKKPSVSLNFFHELNIPLQSSIIDVGGGDSLLVDHLLELGYRDITVLDISAKALEKAKKRLGSLATRVKWVEADASEYRSNSTYDVWHDRAAFHFLTEEEEINSYIQMLNNSLNNSGHLILGTFSEKGPEKCSGLKIRQYSEKSLTNILSHSFTKIRCLDVTHITPSDSQQHYLFCSFKKNNA